MKSITLFALIILSVFAFLKWAPSVYAQGQAGTYSCSWSNNGCTAISACNEHYATGNGCRLLTTPEDCAAANDFLCEPNYYECRLTVAGCTASIANCTDGYTTGNECNSVSASECNTSRHIFTCTSEANCGEENNSCCGVDPVNPRPPCDGNLVCGADNICRSEVCGAEGQACCANNDQCNAGLVCDIYSQTCTSEVCGAEGQACCGWIPRCSGTDSGLYCNSNNKCERVDGNTCGRYNSPCCTGATCADANLICDPATTTCKTNGCGITVGQACCPGDTCYRDGLTCQFGACLTDPTSCGDIGGACCSGANGPVGGCWFGICTNGKCEERPLGTCWDTAIGCAPIDDIKQLAIFAFGRTLGIAGGSAIFLIAVSAIYIMGAKENAEKLQAGKEILTAAIAGLSLLIFASILYRIIGTDILGILSRF